MSSISQNIDALKEVSFANDSEENVGRLRNVLKNDLIKYDIIDLYNYYLDCKQDNNLSQKYVGGIGFLIFTSFVDQFDPELSDDDLLTANKTDQEINVHRKIIEIAEEIVKEICVYGFIEEEYGINKNIDEKPSFIEFHKAGTTSYILKLKFLKRFEGKYVALKILKFKYIDNETIRNKTKNYEATYQNNDNSPKIHHNDFTYILMDFIDGDTLYEYIHKTLYHEPNRYKIISKIIFKLCEVLRYFASSHGIIHGDLNTNNIIINKLEHNDNGEINLKLYLIDFGVNYLLNEKIGSSQALTKAGVYIPREVLKDSANTSLMSDIYSIGVILLEMFNIVDEFEKENFEDYLNFVRQNQPDLAALIDDLLDKNPDLRLYDLQKEYSDKIKRSRGNSVFSNIKQNSPSEKKKITIDFAPIYIGLQSKLNLAFRRLDSTKDKNTSPIFHNFQILLSAISGDLKPLFGTEQSHREISYFNIPDERPDPEKNNFRIVSNQLEKWARIAQLSNLLVLVCSILIFSNYLGLIKIASYPPFINMNLNLTDILSVIVLLSFSSVAVQYYHNIFRYLYTRELGSFGFWNNVWLRFGTFYWPGPILIAFFYDRHWWEYAAFIGTFIVSINNFSNYRLAKKALSEITKTFDYHPSQNILDRLKDYRDWGSYMFIYAITLLTIGILVNNHILHDEIAYLLIILMVNIKMWRSNCTDDAFKINTTLQFLYTRYDRAIKFQRQNQKKY